MSSLFGKLSSYIVGKSPDPEEIITEGERQEKLLNYKGKSYEENLEQHNRVSSIYEQAFRMGAKRALTFIARLNYIFMDFIANNYVIVSDKGEYVISERFKQIAIEFFNKIDKIYEQAIVEISKTTLDDKSDPKRREEDIADVYNNLGMLLCNGLVVKIVVEREIKHVIVEPKFEKGIHYLNIVCELYNDYDACANMAVLYRNKADEFSTTVSDTHISTKVDYYGRSIGMTLIFSENVEKYIEKNKGHQKEIMTRFNEILNVAYHCIKQIQDLTKDNVDEKKINESRKEVLDKSNIKYHSLLRTLNSPSKGGRKRGGKSLTMKSIRTSKKTRNYKKGRRHKKSRRGRIRK
jgi:hypothetical protein